MRIAVEGCMHGDLDTVYKTLQYAEKKHGFKIDLLLCCGDFQVLFIFQVTPKKTQRLGRKFRFFFSSVVGLGCEEWRGSWEPKRAKKVPFHELVLEVLFGWRARSVSYYLHRRKPRGIQLLVGIVRHFVILFQGVYGWRFRIVVSMH